MKYRSTYVLIPLVFLLPIISIFALSSIESKEAIYGDLVLENESLTYHVPEWFRPIELQEASTDASYRINEVLPYNEDRDADIYLVIPQLGLVAPIIQIDKSSEDYTTFISGSDVEDILNKYLQAGILEYPGSVLPGQDGKRIDFGHNAYFANDTGRYKNIFANLMKLDKEDEVRYFIKNGISQEYDLHKYVIHASYNTTPTDVSILMPNGGKEVIILTASHGRDGRWIIDAKYKENIINKTKRYECYRQHLDCGARDLKSCHEWLGKEFNRGIAKYGALNYIRIFEEMGLLTKDVTTLEIIRKQAIDYQAGIEDILWIEKEGSVYRVFEGGTLHERRKYSAAGFVALYITEYIGDKCTVGTINIPNSVK